MKKKTVLRLIAVSAWVCLRAQAAVITWDSAADISSLHDVSTAGTLVEAFNAGGNGVADRTVNGVLFTGTGALMSENTDQDIYDGTTGDAAYNALLGDIDYGGGEGLNTATMPGTAPTWSTGLKADSLPHPLTAG